MEDNKKTMNNSALVNVDAKRSEKPFLVLIIVGSAVLTLAIILIIAGISTLTLSLVDQLGEENIINRTLSLDELDFSTPGIIAATVLLSVGFGSLLPGVALLGVGIPMYIVTRKRKRRALAQLEKAE